MSFRLPVVRGAALRRASTQTEYVLIAAIVSVAVLAGAAAVGSSLGGVFNGLAEFFAGG